ncbi:glucosylglycerol-phosphate synthase [Synechococcus sp. RSCCF101]|uniref:glucosylglycerol-phosphate synthase n=1 Tax=Synechococcus sp. RSCCF101 TaxID=2511069 RepID=UPI001247B494|nr:glucosylglycerol-phosphate synthase [Synechococcus sp. RSCCF101]QEY31691.1 glucosylglycerol-phosphate synthase [Synechococcus sp. RSCCF101]
MTLAPAQINPNDNQPTQQSDRGRSDFILLYHRSPYDEAWTETGEREWRDQKSPNGIIPTLRNLFLTRTSGTWIAWRQVDCLEGSEDECVAMDRPAPFTLRRIPLVSEQISSFYHVTSKESVWPILHTFPTHFNINNADWDTFQDVNRRFALAACAEAAEGAVVWIHDYNLWLAAATIRASRPDLRIAFFHHTPFPSEDVFAILPWREQILDSLLCCDLVGFHIPRYLENFARAATSLLGAEKAGKRAVDPMFRPTGSALAEPLVTPTLRYRDREVGLLASPVGTAPDVIQNLRSSDHVQAMSARIDADTKKNRKLIFSASRVDYTKGNEELLLAFERLMERREDLHGEVVLMLACVAAATGMKIYEDTQRSIEETAGRINGRFGRMDWVPVRLSTQRIPYEEMVAWFSRSDICWITPLRDGLNLVAKEYVASRRDMDGVLVLSEFTGASVVLDGAILTNPYSHRRMDDAIEQALAMPADEQRRRMATMTAAVESFTVSHWADHQLAAIAA